MPSLIALSPRSNSTTVSCVHELCNVRPQETYPHWPACHRGIKWAVSEPNEEPLWAQIRRSVGAFMNRLVRPGALQGTYPRSAYVVQCGKSTTTQTHINRGVEKNIVAFALLQPAEFVVIKLRQTAGRA